MRHTGKADLAGEKPDGDSERLEGEPCGPWTRENSQQENSC